jgi:hypothetical protein
MLLRKINSIYFDIYIKPTNTLCGQDADLLMSVALGGLVLIVLAIGPRVCRFKLG